MKLYRIIVAFLCVQAAPALAIDLIDAEEKGRLTDIERDFGVDEMLIANSERVSRLMKREHEFSDLARELELKQARYDEAIGRLPTTILEKGDTRELYAEIETLVGDIEALKRKTADEKQAIAGERAAIAADHERIEARRTTRSTKLLELKASIARRIAAALAGPSGARPIADEGSMKCSRFKSLNECLKDARRAIIAASIEDDPFLNDSSVLLSFEMVDASVNLDGDLRYSARLSFKPSYTNEVDALLNEALGLNSAQVKLVSNVPAEWYMDGVKVGEGTEISRDVPFGRHGIVAAYRSQQQSTVETIQGNRVLRYSFDTERLAAGAPERAGDQVASSPPRPRGATASKKRRTTTVAPAHSADDGNPGTPVADSADTCAGQKGGCSAERDPVWRERQSRDAWRKSMGLQPASQ